MVETIFACKWSLTVYRLIAQEIRRPGEMARTVEGLSTKVLNDCLRRNVEFGILEKRNYPELPPRVEYYPTQFGERFIAVLDSLEDLERELPGNDT